MYRLNIIFFIFLILCSCNNPGKFENEEYIVTQSGHLNLLPLPKPGKKFTCSFDTKDIKEVSIFFQYQVIDSTFQVTSYDIDSVAFVGSEAHVSVTIPNNAISFIIQMFSDKQRMPVDFIQSPVFDHTGIPIKGSFRCYYNLSDAQNLKLLRKYDSLNLLRSLDKIDILSFANSKNDYLEQLISKIKKEFDSLLQSKNESDKLKGLILASYFSVTNGESVSLKNELAMIDQLLTNHQLNDNDFSNLLNLILNQYLFIVRKSSYSGDQKNDFDLPIIKLIVEISSLIKKSQYQILLFKNLSRSKVLDSIEIPKYSENFVENNIFTEDTKEILKFINQNPDFYIYYTEYLKHFGKKDRVKKYLEKNYFYYKNFDSLKNDLKIANPGKNNGIYENLLKNLAEIYTQTGETKSALEKYEEILMFKDTFFNQGAKSLAAIGMTDIYISQDSIDKAEVYLRIAAQMNSPFASDKLSELNILRKTKGLTALSFEDVFSGNKFIEDKKELSKTQKDHLLSLGIDTEFYKDTVIILTMYDEECYACNIGSINFHHELDSLEKIPYKSFVVSDADLFVLRKYYGNKIEIIPKSKFEKSLFGINEIPYIIIIRNNKIIYSDSSVPTNLQTFRHFFTQQKKSST
jgi:hypothetical protein